MTNWKMLAIAAGAMTLTACAGGTDCDKAADRIEDRSIECGLDIPDDTGTEDTDFVEPECTDTLAEQSLCIADCYEAAPCEALDGSDTDAAAELGTCLSEC